MGGMVCCNRVQCPIPEPFLYSLDILGSPQRRVHLCAYIVSLHSLFCKSKIMRGSLSSYPCAPRLSVSDYPYRSFSAHVGNMEPCACQLRQGNVPGYHHVLSSIWNPLKSKSRGCYTFVHTPA